MKPRVRVSCWRSLRARSSIRVCEERLACKGNKPISSYYCEDCRSNQCDLCEALLHEDERLASHSRQPVVDAPGEFVCDGNCPERNFADVSCAPCNAKFCYPCDRKIHSKDKKRSHVRRRFIKEVEEEFVSCEGIPAEPVTDQDCCSMMSMSAASDPSSDQFHSESEEAELPTVGNNRGTQNTRSFLLLNDKEQLQVTSDEFVENLGCDSKNLLKVISVFGNTGDGKSYTLNHTFYDGKEIFSTSDSQSSCTIGVWAAYCQELNAITIDTEGFLGQATNPNSRARLLLKVLAVSDVVIYRTRAERLHNDMFYFLGDASAAYIRHFSKELEEISSKCNIEGPVSALGPAVVVFHETHHTLPLSDDAEITLRKRFRDLKLKLDSFSSLDYVGTKTITPPTDFKCLKQCVQKLLVNSSIRTARPAEVIYSVLKALNDKFSNSLDSTLPSTFPDEYFTCPVRCLSCYNHCIKSMNHSRDGESHVSSSECIYRHQYKNQIFLCKSCYERGERIVVTPTLTESNDSSIAGYVKYMVSGYVLECTRCGTIYRSREYWFGNKEPEETCVRTELCHVWPGENDEIVTSHTAQSIIDSMASATEVVQQLSSKPAKVISSWMADKVAPSYWTPNSEIKDCGLCGKEFENDSKHHCRSCGGGFCDDCSSKTMVVAGWGPDPVRVCDKCYDNGGPENDVVISQPNDVAPRKITEAVQSTLGTVASVITNQLAGVIKASARPDYWEPDELITHCCVCKSAFSPKLSIHHCRSCGKGVCDSCSTNRRTIKSRGWTSPVRVCDTCVKEEKELKI